MESELIYNIKKQYIGMHPALMPMVGMTKEKIEEQKKRLPKYAEIIEIVGYYTKRKR
jgi:hypothetical protein